MTALIVRPREGLSWVLIVCGGFVNISGLTQVSVYEHETASWALQGKGQDIGNLIAIVSCSICLFFFRKYPLRAYLI